MLEKQNRRELIRSKIDSFGMAFSEEIRERIKESYQARFPENTYWQISAMFNVIMKMPSGVNLNCYIDLGVSKGTTAFDAVMNFLYRPYEIDISNKRDVDPIIRFSEINLINLTFGKHYNYYDWLPFSQIFDGLISVRRLKDPSISERVIVNSQNKSNTRTAFSQIREWWAEGRPDFYVKKDKKTTLDWWIITGSLDVECRLDPDDSTIVDNASYKRLEKNKETGEITERDLNPEEIEILRIKLAHDRIRGKVTMPPDINFGTGFGPTPDLALWTWLTTSIVADNEKVYHREIDSINIKVHKDQTYYNCEWFPYRELSGGIVYLSKVYDESPFVVSVADIFHRIRKNLNYE